MSLDRSAYDLYASAVLSSLIQQGEMMDDAKRKAVVRKAFDIADLAMEERKKRIGPEDVMCSTCGGDWEYCKDGCW